VQNWIDRRIHVLVEHHGECESPKRRGSVVDHGVAWNDGDDLRTGTVHGDDQSLRLVDVSSNVIDLRPDLTISLGQGREYGPVLFDQVDVRQHGLATVVALVRFDPHLPDPAPAVLVHVIIDVVHEEFGRMALRNVVVVRDSRVAARGQLRSVALWFGLVDKHG